MGVVCILIPGDWSEPIQIGWINWITDYCSQCDNIKEPILVKIQWSKRDYPKKVEHGLYNASWWITVAPCC